VVALLVLALLVAAGFVLGTSGALIGPPNPRSGPEAWVVDDTGFPKKGRHSVGVARQYCGQLGKQDNSQVAVSLSVAGEAASLPIAYRLYLPKGWTEDPVRRANAGVPEDVAFMTKPLIALGQIEAALAADVPRGVVLADAGYGADMKFQAQLLQLELAYVVGVQPGAKVWPAGRAPLPPKTWSGRGRPPSNLRQTSRPSCSASSGRTSLGRRHRT
jgi:SRSO17 transposase